METKLLTAGEAAATLGVHPKTISRLLRLGKLEGQKLANRWLIEQSTLKKFRRHYVGKKGRPSGYSPRRRGR